MAVNRKARELQIARNLVTLRWASIPVIFSFCLIFLNGFGMSFQIEPIYIICCVLAAVNIYFTLHIAMIARQFDVTRGLTTLKRLMSRVLSSFFGSFNSKGILALVGIPKVIVKISSVIYLMILEALKDFPINPLSLDNVMHIQIIFDLVTVICITRYTGSTESPMFLLAAIPIAVAGSVINTKAGLFYSVLACCGWFVNAALIKYGFMNHIKFYSGAVGDLHDCNGWIGSYSMVALTSFGAFALISHKLTEAFKIKVSELDKSLFESRSNSAAYRKAAQLEPNSWFTTDENFVIQTVKPDKIGVILSNMVGKPVFDALPKLKKTDFDMLARSVMVSRFSKKLTNIKLNDQNGNEHIFDLGITSYKDFNNKIRLIVYFEETTNEILRKEQVEELTAEYSQLNTNLEMVTFENMELHKSIDTLSKVSADKSVEIEVLNTKINDLDLEAVNQSNKISELMDEVAAVKADNEQLNVEINNKQMLLDDVCELVESCGELDELVAKLEKHTRDLFGLENSCFHVFDSSDVSRQRGEILDMRKVSPRLLDIPRSHPETLNPALTEGRPVVFCAEFRPEKSAASLAISNGDLKRLVAFLPLKEDNQILGMMMLEKYGTGNSSENIVDMVSMYLKYVAGAIKTAVENKKIQNSNKELHQDMLKVHTKLDSIKAMIDSDCSHESRPFSSLLFEISKLVPMKDAMLVSTSADGNLEALSRIDRSKNLELTDIEKEISHRIISDHSNKITFKSENDIDDCVAYPFVEAGRLFGILFVYCNEETNSSLDYATLDFCVSLLKNRYALHVLNQERAAWESFYCQSVPA